VCVDSAAAEYVSFDVGSAAGCASAGCNFEHHVVQCGGCCGCASAVFSLREVETCSNLLRADGPLEICQDIQVAGSAARGGVKLA
jgi:hypothetical protein